MPVTTRSKSRASDMQKPILSDQPRDHRVQWKTKREVAETPSPVMSDAVSRVFSTPELTEMIFLGLDMKTLLMVQRVSSGFKANIDGSKKCQKKLFFEPATWEESRGLNLVENCHFYTWHGGDITAQTHNVWRVGPKSQDCEGDCEMVVHNPLLLKAQEAIPYRSFTDGDQFSRLSLWSRQGNDGPLEGKGGQKRVGPPTNPSWTKMHLVQPANFQIDAVIKGLVIGGEIHRSFDSRSKFGTILEQAEGHEYEKPTSGGAFRRTTIIFGHGKPFNRDLIVRGMQTAVKDVLNSGLGFSHKDAANWNKFKNLKTGRPFIVPAEFRGPCDD